MGHLKLLLWLSYKWNSWILQCNIAFKRCRQNNKQSRHWSDCSLRSSLIWVCTVCTSLSVPIFQIITVARFTGYTCLEHIFMVPKVFEPFKFYCSLFTSFTWAVTFDKLYNMTYIGTWQFRVYFPLSVSALLACFFWTSSPFQ